MSLHPLRPAVTLPLLVLLLSGPAFSPAAAQTRPATGVTAAQTRPAAGVTATVNSESFGYKLTCSINGHDVGFKGNGQDIVAFVGETRGLHPGRNTVAITYTRIAKGFGQDLSIKFTVPGYPAPLFFAHVGEAQSGKLQGAFDISDVPPKDFKPLYLSEYPSGASGFLYLDQDASASGNFALSVDGNDSSTSYQGRLRYAVPLPRLHPGVNKVAVTFDTHGGPLRLFVAGPTAGSLQVLDSPRKTTRTFPGEGTAG